MPDALIVLGLLGLSAIGVFALFWVIKELEDR